mmetsp:Transcript_16110/g.29459  ORF Transcript_16110/g.29459 Transcript_16110/m.29459 type:complete len:571 (-) Transcript_16110:88-1800(-)
MNRTLRGSARWWRDADLVKSLAGRRPLASMASSHSHIADVSCTPAQPEALRRYGRGTSLPGGSGVDKFNGDKESPEDDGKDDDEINVTLNSPDEPSSETTTKEEDVKVLTPNEIVTELDKHIVGQGSAKRSVAIALRNRWRRQQLDEDLRDEVSPKNILMIGSTGVGKTEIGRRLAKLAQAPFVKVEATKFTEVGFHGRDVDKIIQDLVDTSLALVKQVRLEKEKKLLESIVEEQILDILTGKSSSETRKSFKDLLRKGQLDKHSITIDAPASGGSPLGGAVALDGNAANPAHMQQIFSQIGKLMGGPKREKRKMTIKEARSTLMDMEIEQRMDATDLTREAITLAEQHGIVFIDEIDKVVSTSDNRSSADASAEGVQRDLLPLIEGSVVNTKQGNVKTDHMLFIASGAFHYASPADLLPELQGRLPIRVELESLSEEDLHRILTEPAANLIYQQTALLGTEGLALEWDEDAVKEMASFAAEINSTVENIGARRLHTIVERLVEDLSFQATEIVSKVHAGEPIDESIKEQYTIAQPAKEGDKPVVRITVDLVKKKLKDFLQESDYNRYIL